MRAPAIDWYFCLVMVLVMLATLVITLFLVAWISPGLEVAR